MSGLSTPMFFGLIASQVVTTSLTDVAVSKAVKEREALTGAAVIVIALMLWLAIGWTALNLFPNQFGGLDREAWVMALPISAFTGSFLYVAGAGFARMIRARNNV